MKIGVRFALALGVLGLGLSAGADEVVSKTLDKPVRGTIVKDDEESVEINIPGGGMTIPVKRADVVRVKYDLLINHYDAGMTLFNAGQYE